MNSQPTKVRYVVLFGLCLAAGLAYVHRGCLSVMESTIREDLEISKSDMGWIMGGFFWAYALFQIPTGLLVDRWGPRRALLLFGMLGAATIAISAGKLWTNAATGFVLLFVARVLMGIAQAGLFPASTRAMSNWIPLKLRASAAGTLQACMSLGGAVGAFLTAQLMGIVSWPWVFLIYAVPGILWSAWFFAWFRDRPDEHRSTNEAERALLRQPEAKTPAAKTNWLVLLTSLPVFLLCVQQFFRAGASAFWFGWCPTYLQETYKLDKQTAGELTSLPIIGFMLGSIGGGIVADWLYHRTGSRRISRSGTAIGATFLGGMCFGLTFLLRDAGTSRPRPRGVPGGRWQLVCLQRGDGSRRAKFSNRVWSHEHVRQLRSRPILAGRTRMGRLARLAGDGATGRGTLPHGNALLVAAKTGWKRVSTRRSNLVNSSRYTPCAVPYPRHRECAYYN